MTGGARRSRFSGQHLELVERLTDAPPQIPIRPIPDPSFERDLEDRDTGLGSQAGQRVCAEGRELK